MKKMGLNEIREQFLRFFESKDHLRLPSFSLVPHNDPSVLLINAGMTPLKPYFTGAEKPPRNRITTCQKCIRTPDIENVGKTARHGTFFEMLGNFSFGDYFKKEAIQWAWEFVTEVMGMPGDRLYVSIYEEDEEAFEIWNRDVGIAPERIFRMGKEDNFWEHGTGPCGPCSEIYFDRGPERGCGQPDCTVGCECDRYIEFWNLVFTQFNRQEDGTYTKLEKRNIDTGMGLERLAVIMQDVENLFEVDTIRRILEYVCNKAGVMYGEGDDDVSIRVITDHIRSTTMMVSDGILPSNEGRGYVLRRLLRRAARHGRLLGIEGPFLHDVAKVVIRESSEAYPELAEKEEYICKVIKTEEDRFAATIDQGIAILNAMIAELKLEKKDVLPGDMAFKLHDTYGFPLDLTREIAEEAGLTVDEQGFRAEMEEQKNKARMAIKNKEISAWGQDLAAGIEEDLSTEFVGYESYSSESKILYIILDGEQVDSAQKGEEVTIILDRTPFYAESGGQVADTGVIAGKDGKVRVNDCNKTGEGLYLHSGIVEEGIIEKGTPVTATIDVERRLAIARNHTVTHLLHKALRNVLGDHVTQAGSLVEPDRLRFDFRHFSAMTKEEIKQVEEEVNARILDDLEVLVREMPVDEANRIGAIALFGEKYGDIVRVVQAGEYSTELCGGTHLKSTAQAGLFKIVSEGGVAAGVRRIEALTGKGALVYYDEVEEKLENIASVLKTTPQESLRRVETISAELKAALKEIEQLKAKLASSSFDEVLENAEDVDGVRIVTGRFDQLDMEALRNTCESLRSKAGTGVVVLASALGGKVSFVAMATKDAVARGIHCGNIVKEAAKAAGGGGGGRPDMAQAGGKDVSKIDEALRLAAEAAKAQIK
ncbi:MAG: alanine--tRNA ligase [Acetivibrionales bacterium]|jgi:alanyl-tRNA synthetase|nr:alanine--tRNA ligase [Bacillota bacterium]NLP07525.1 alanine--tRNA ligase [Clostridiaceae bacterium]